MKKCPNCQCEVIEWHYYCPNCHTIIKQPEMAGSPGSTFRGRVERSLVTWVFIGGFVIGSGVLAWTIDWRGLGRLLRGQTMTQEEVIDQTRSIDEKLARRRLPRQRQETSEAVGPTTVPGPVTTGPATELAVVRPGETERNPVERPAAASRRPEIAPEVEIDQYETAPTDKSGIVSINCPVPARVYIDGQYSGVTPRTVHLLAGAHQIRLVADGYLEWNNLIQVRSRHQMGVLASMTRAE
jgi:hypothetical protein